MQLNTADVFCLGPECKIHFDACLLLSETKCLDERSAVRLVMLEENRQNETARTTEELLWRV